jgi:ParB family chromosome partitioning protein
MADAYAVDGTLLDLIKDREVLDAMVAEVAGQQAADANAKATGKVKRQIIADCLSGTNGRAKIERFVPRWIPFPPSAYTARGGVATVSRAAAVEHLSAPSADNQAEPEPQSDAEPVHASEPVAQAA